MRPSGEITVFLHQCGAGRDQTFLQLLALAYEPLPTIASALMRSERPDHTLQPTALIGELYLKLANQQTSGWKDRDHFYHFCARAMR